MNAFINPSFLISLLHGYSILGLLINKVNRIREKKTLDPDKILKNDKKIDCTPKEPPNTVHRNL